MKKKTNFLARVSITLLLAVLSSTGAWAADVVTVGSGTTANGSLPSNQFSNYFVSQQIYTSSEIGRSGMITSIAFYNYDTGRLRDYDIYLTHIDKNAFDNNIDWVMVTEADKVFSGKVTLIDWTAIELDKPFVYNGTKNLLLTVVDHSNSRISNDNLCRVFDGSSQALYYNSSVSLDPTKPMEKEGTINNKKNVIQLCFDTYPKPNKLEAVEVGDVRALIQWSLRGDATATNLRYRKVGTEAWTTMNDLTTRSKTIENLDPATQYETQVQAVFSGNKTSDWTDVLTFTTSCCPLESQAEIIYKLNSTNGWFNSAVQIVDVTNEDKPIEVAYLRSVYSGLGEGIVTLCCGHSYKVNWIYDEARKWNNSELGFTLYFQPGDAFYTMAFGEAPEENAQLTEFVMDCGDYCAPMPKNVSVDDIFHDGAILSFTSTTAGGKIAYSTEADFNPATATNTLSVTFDAGGNGMSEGSSGGSEVSYRLTGLESQTDYYVALQSVCTAQPWDDGGKSRWTKPVKVKTGPEEAPVDNITVVNDGSSKSKVSWTPKGRETKHNVYIRQQTGAGKPVDASQIQMFNLIKEDGATYENWGGGQYASRATSGETSKWFVVTGVPANAVVKTTTDEADTKTKMTNTKGVTTEVFSSGAEKQENDGSNVEALKDEIKTKITNLKKVRDDGKKLSKKQWKEKYRLYKKAQLDWDDAEEGSAEEKALEEQMKSLKRELGLDKRNVKKAVKRGTNAGFKAYKRLKKSKKTRAADTEEYFVWFNHEDGVGYFSISELEIVTEENLGDWTSYQDVTDNSYTFDNLTPGTTYEVMIEPVYDDGTTGPEDVFLFTTFGTEADPIEGEFSVSADKKVQFAKGNLRYEGDIYGYEAEWSMAKQQYEVLGDANIQESYGSSYQTYPTDLLCWSTTNNYYGVSTYYWWDEDEIKEAFKGDFVDWGSNPTLISQLGQGWSTLSKDEWNYLLNERENAAQLKSFATITIDAENKVKGLVILPDEWDAPDGVLLSNEMTTEQWAAVEQTGAVFLPVTGHLWVWKDGEGNNQASVNGLDVIGNYWTSTPSDEESGDYACALNFNTEVDPDVELERRLGCAVRLVKEVNNETDLSGIFADGCSWATYVAEESLTTPAGLQAYVVSEATATEVTATPTDFIPAGVAVLLNRTEVNVSEYKAKPYTSGGENPSSLLVGSATETTGITPYQDFVLYNDEFVLSSVATVAAGHAYLPVTTVPAGARTMIIVIGGDATAIKSIKHVSTDNDAWYTIDGRRLNRKPTAKGLYIHHDKKFVIK